LKLAQARTDAALHVESRELLACSTFHQGLFADALAHAQAGLASYDPAAHNTLIPLHGHNLQPAFYAWRARSQWFLGFPEQAVQDMAWAVQAGRDLGHEPSLASVLLHAAFLHQFGGDAQAARETAAEALELAVANG